MPPISRRSQVQPYVGRRPKVAGRNPAPRRPGQQDDPSAADPTNVESLDRRDTEPADRTLGTPEVSETAPENGKSSEPADVPANSVSLEKDRSAATSAEVERSEPAMMPRSVQKKTAPEAATEVAEPDTSRHAGLRTVVVLAVGTVVVALFAFVAWKRPGAEVSNDAWVNSADTSEVASAARSAIETVYSYKYDTVDADFDEARSVLNDEMLAEFDKTAAMTIDAVKQTKTETVAEVTDIGVKLLSDDRAELVANMLVSASNDGVAQSSAEGPISVSMEKIDGTWRLSKIDDDQ